MCFFQVSASAVLACVMVAMRYVWLSISGWGPMLFDGMVVDNIETEMNFISAVQSPQHAIQIVPRAMTSLPPAFRYQAAQRRRSVLSAMTVFGFSESASQTEPRLYVTWRGISFRDNMQASPRISDDINSMSEHSGLAPDAYRAGRLSTTGQERGAGDSETLYPGPLPQRSSVGKINNLRASCSSNFWSRHQ